MHKHLIGGVLDYNYIINGIYIGNNQCCTVGIQEVLQKENITTDISLEEVKLDQPFGVEVYVWIPTPDHTPPTPDQLSFGVSVIQKLVSQNKKIYIHCKNGHGRSSTLIGAYLIATGMTLDNAITLIKERRPSAHLQENQIKALKNFSQTQKNER